MSDIVSAKMSKVLDDALVSSLDVSPADEIQSLRQRVERLEVALRIFLGGDDRFQVMIGGNPDAVENMLEEARALVGSDGHGSHKGEDCYRCSKCDEYEYRIDR